MPFIATKYAALVFGVCERALRHSSTRNTAREFTKFQNKLLFKVTSAQLRIALDKGLIDANTPVYNDDLRLIQDFFKIDSRRVNGRNRKATASDEKLRNATVSTRARASSAKIGDGEVLYDAGDFDKSRCTQQRGYSDRNNNKCSVNATSLLDDARVLLQRDGDRETKANKAVTRCKQGELNGRERNNKLSSEVCKSSGGHTKCDDGRAIRCDEVSNSSSKNDLLGKYSHIHRQSSEYGDGKNTRKTDLANNKSNKQSSTQHRENERANECEHTVGDTPKGKLGGMGHLQNEKGELDVRANFTASTSIGIYGDVCCSDESICELLQSARFVDKEQNTNTCGTSVSNDYIGRNSRDYLGAVDAEYIKYGSFSLSSDSVYGQYKTKTNIISNVGRSAAISRADKTSISHTQRKTNSYGQTEQNDTKFNANHTQGELNANNKENSSDIKDNANDAKHDARDKEARTRLQNNNECLCTGFSDGREDKRARELTQSTSTLFSTAKGLKPNSSSKASNANETSTLKKCLNERNINNNYALLSTRNEELAAANEKALILSKIEQRVANNESVKSICADLNISRQQYYRMLKAYKTQGLAGLVDKRTTAKDSKTGEIIPDVLKNLALDLWRGFGAGGCNLAHLHSLLHAQAYKLLNYDYKGFLTNKTNELFSVQTLSNFIKNYKKQNHLEALVVEKGFDKAKSYAQPSMGNQRQAVKYRNEKWQIDSSPLDMILKDEQGNEFRPHILSVVDVFSGRCVAILSETSNALSLVRLLWKAIDTMGLPECIKGDNGKDYLSNHFQSVLNKLGIFYENTPAYSGELKAFVERQFKSLQHSFIANSVGAIGYDLCTRQAIEQRTAKKERSAKNEFGKIKKTNQSNLLNLDEAKQLLENAVNYWNLVSNKRVKNRISRIDAFNSCDNPLIKITYEYFLARAGECVLKKVQKKGININSRTYISCDMPSVGTSVRVVTNIDNIAEIYVYDEKFNFICIAKDNTIANLSAEEYKESKKAFNKELQAINKVIKDVNVGEFTRQTLQIEKKVLKELNEEKLSNETHTILDDKASKNYKEKGKLLKEVSTCSDYAAPKIQEIKEEREMSYEDLIINSNIS